MHLPIKDISNARILVTNDDGIHAPGLKLLEKVAKSLSKDVWVVAPEVEQSGAGHSLSISMPIRYRELSPKRFAVSGTPTDCVLAALRAIIPDDKKVSLVLSGVNRGANVAEDVTHSGTLAAAMEATLNSIPAIAFSQYFAFWEPAAKVHWGTAEANIAKLVKQLVAKGWSQESFISVNFPDCIPASVKGIKVVPHGRRDSVKQLTKVIDPKGRPYFWVNWADEGLRADREDCDLKWLLKKYITVTPIKMDLTDYNSLAKLKKSF